MTPPSALHETVIFLWFNELRFLSSDPLTNRNSELILFGHAEATPES